MKIIKLSLLLIGVALMVPFTAHAQEDDIGQKKSKKYINIGYVTNLQKCDECKRADTGGSIRIGVLREKRLGYYGGFIFFNEYHPDWEAYDDKGYLFIAGLDYRILKSNDFEWYAKAGLALEYFVSPYRNSTRVETERSFKPDFGFLFNFRHFNVVFAWQPSEPHHYNLGIGYSFYSEKGVKNN
jgi:hypothetical protein